jgi:hypothetical protein
MADIKEHMEVIGADGVHVGAVEKVEGSRIKLTKKDSGEPRCSMGRPNAMRDGWSRSGLAYEKR